MRRAQHVRALGHEVHAAEHDVVGIGTVGHLPREPERVAGVVRELDHLVALVVVAEDDEPAAQRGLRGRDARVHLLVGQARGTCSGSGWRSEMCCFSCSVRSGMMVDIVRRSLLPII